MSDLGFLIDDSSEAHYRQVEIDIERVAMAADTAAARLTTEDKKPGYIMTQGEAVKLQDYIMVHALGIMGGKRRDYSGKADPFRNLRSAQALGVESWRGAFVRMMDKVSRIRSITESGGAMEVQESLIDTFADMVNYTCIAAGLVWETLGLEIPDDAG